MEHTKECWLDAAIGPHTADQHLEHIKKPVCHSVRPESQTFCLHCQSAIWDIQKYQSLYDWRNQFGEVCSDGLFHLPARAIWQDSRPTLTEISQGIRQRPLRSLD